MGGRDVERIEHAEASETDKARPEKKIWWRSPGALTGTVDYDRFEHRDFMVWVWIAIFVAVPIVGFIVFGEMGFFLGGGFVLFMGAFGGSYTFLAFARLFQLGLLFTFGGMVFAIIYFSFFD